MAIETGQLLALWKVEDLPACDEGMELARIFLTRCGDAVDQVGKTTDTGEPNTIGLRNAMIRAHKDLVFHHSTCPKCNEE